jgi:hypothetical protein
VTLRTFTADELKTIFAEHTKWRLNNVSGKRADLSWANLSGANLWNVIVVETCLDPDNAPNADAGGFCSVGEHIVGYRTEAAGHIGKYRVGRVYSADWFSTSDAECHPGLYLWPTENHARDFSGEVPLIKVETNAADIHHAGRKWRTRWFRVIEKL